MSRARRRAAAWALLALPACRTGDLPPPAAAGDDAAITAARAAGTAPFRLAVAPVSRGAGLLGAAAEGPDPARHRLAPDPGRVRAGLVEALAAAGLFRRVAARGPDDGPAPRGAEDAWRAGDDLVLEVELTDYRQEFLGHEHYLSWLVLLTSFVWPAWFVEVDAYGVGLEATVRLRGVQGSTPPLLEARYVVDGRTAAQALTPLDRTLVGPFDLGALWSVEASLEPSHWAAIDRLVAPHALRRLEAALVRDLAARVVGPLAAGPTPARDDLLRRARKRLAVVVGVSTHADGGPGPTPAAAGDAAAVASAWASPAGGGLAPGRDLRTLVDAQATRAAILEAVAAAGARAAPGDEVLVYFAGRATTLADARPALVPHDASTADVASSALPLDALLARIPAGVRAALVVDAAVDAPAGGERGAGPAAAPDLAGLLRALGPGRCALLAARPGEPARDATDAGRGLLTHVLLEALGGGADVDADGRTTWPEVARFVDDEVRRRAGLDGAEQTPVALGEGEVAWPR